MRNLQMAIPVVALAGLIGVSMAAQQQPPAPSEQARGNTSAPAVPVSSTSNVPEVVNRQLRPVTGELEKKLDTKNAKSGDPVVVKTTEEATTADGVVIPKGSKIMGHVTEVQAHTKTNENARLTLQFDQVQLKNGQTMPIKTVLQSVAPAEVTVHPTDTMNSQTSGMATPMGSPGGSTTGMAGAPRGGAPGGGADSAAQAAGGAPAMSGNSQTQSSNAAPKTGTVVETQGNVAIKTTAIPGVLLATNANGQPFSNASGALLGTRQNVHLDGGTEIVLAVADSGPMPGAR